MSKKIFTVDTKDSTYLEYAVYSMQVWYTSVNRVNWVHLKYNR